MSENSHPCVPASHDNRETPAETDGDKTELGIGMSNSGQDTQPPFPDGLDRVFPIRSVIEIEPPNSDNQSSSSHDRGTRRGSEGVTSSISAPDEPTYGWGTSGWMTKSAQAGGHGAPYTTTRITHRTTIGGHMVAIGNAGAETLQRCEVSTT